MKVRHIDVALPEHPEHIALLQVLEPGEAAAFVGHRELFAVRALLVDAELHAAPHLKSFEISPRFYLAVSRTGSSS
jgi:hypothetical protein